MLAKEAITNVLKHASATRIEVQLDYAPDRVTLRIADNGCGFAVAAAQGPHAGHFGITGMKERAARLQGSFLLTSAPREGTRVTITVPLTARAAD